MNSPRPPVGLIHRWRITAEESVIPRCSKTLSPLLDTCTVHFSVTAARGSKPIKNGEITEAPCLHRAHLQRLDSYPFFQGCRDDRRVTEPQRPDEIGHKGGQDTTCGFSGADVPTAFSIARPGEVVNLLAQIAPEAMPVEQRADQLSPTDNMLSG